MYLWNKNNEGPPPRRLHRNTIEEEQGDEPRKVARDPQFPSDS